MSEHAANRESFLSPAVVRHVRQSTMSGRRSCFYVGMPLRQA